MRRRRQAQLYAYTFDQLCKMIAMHESGKMTDWEYITGTKVLLSMFARRAQSKPALPSSEADPASD